MRNYLAGKYLRHLLRPIGLLVLIFTIPVAHSEQPTLPGPQTLNLPYGFYSEHFGVAAAYVYGRMGFPQPQAAVMGTVMAGSKGSTLAFGMLQDYRFDFSDRIFLDGIAQVGYITDTRIYTSGNPNFPAGDAGKNNSNKEDYIEGDATDINTRINIKWVLPIGAGRDQPLDIDVLKNGLPVAQDSDYSLNANPIEHGRTYLELRPFYRSQQLDLGDEDSSLRTNGAELSLFYDNRDFVRSPSRGGSYRFRWSRDWGWGDSSSEWETVGFEMDRYISLGETDAYRQRVVAFNLWTVTSPSWNDRSIDGDEIVYSRPPAYAGATLGGLFRMRGYPSSRFNDRAAMYYSAEARVIPTWNPFTQWHWLQERVGVQWWQWVVFAEAGRVAESWDLEQLHSSMKWDVGAGIRLMAKGLVIRADLAYSEEDIGIQMFIGQPFQF